MITGFYKEKKFLDESFLEQIPTPPSSSLREAHFSGGISLIDFPGKKGHGRKSRLLQHCGVHCNAHLHTFLKMPPNQEAILQLRNIQLQRQLHRDRRIAPGATSKYTTL
jgi:hypothetical protein